MVDGELRRAAERDEARALAIPLLSLADEVREPARFDQAAAELLVELEPIQAAAILSGRAGQWDWLGAARRTRFAPDVETLCSDCLDAEQAVHSKTTTVVPLSRQPAIVLALAKASESGDAREFAALTEALGILLAAARRRLLERLARLRRVERLETILDIAQQWHQSQDLTSLLHNMAHAATDLLDAERASIFLWDKRNGVLVGRPALGVENGELRIPDDQGVVGDVVQSGELRRVDHNPLDQQEIDRSVDEQLDFVTRTLLCAPLRGVNGELFGAFELINKIDGNFSNEDEVALLELARHAAIALESTQQHEHLVQSREQVAAEAADSVELIGDCQAIQDLRARIERVAGTELAVLILGENGCGKEVVSRMIHYQSDRRGEPFVAVNCAAIAETLLESELFGHEAGAFTDARETRIGKFELAAEGTLFLDEIGDMSSGGQAKLLRVLEEKIVTRVGGATPIPTNARVIAATNQDLTALVQDNRFREDLFFRLNVVTLELPPLRERGDDVLLLAEHFLERFSAQARRPTPQLMASAKKKLLAHAWPGNVRELRNVMERLVFLSSETQIDEAELTANLTPGGARGGRDGAIAEDLTLNEATREFQVDYIKRRIQRMRGNVAAAARRLGLHRSNLYRKMRQLGMDDVDP